MADRLGALDRLGAMGALRALARDAVLDALAVLAPVTCAGCGGHDRAVCDGCRSALAAVPRVVHRDGPDGRFAVHAALEYAGVAAAAIGAFKDGGRTDAASVLAASLGAAIGAALAMSRLGPVPVELAVVPSTARAMRERGYAPVELLLARSRLRPARVLRLARERVDQAGLGVDARRANAAGGLVAVAPLAGRRFLLVDDIVTTGSTLAEAARALHAAGASTAGAAVLAETPLRRASALGELDGNTP